ncbi:MAG: hypothetical protein FJ317_05520 [SAR202 cluster bacterium]|nr:hypothetical protein [SAR202 cluster bacterium]
MGKSRKSGLEDALERLVLCLTIQETAGLRKPPKLRRPEVIAAARALIDPLEAVKGAADRGEISPAALLRAYLRTVFGLRRLTGTLWAAPSEVWRAALARFRAHARRLRPVAPYAASAPSEAQAIRIATLLCLTGHRAEAARVLTARLRSGLVSPRVTRLLADWLRDLGESKAAALLPSEADTATPTPAVRKHEPRRLRYGVVVMTMFDTEVFRASLRSLVESDFTGTIVVAEDGIEPDRACESFARSLGVSYVKSPRWDGCAATLNLGVAAMPPDVDIVLSSHNDVLWPSRWFADLDRAWEYVWDTDKVSLLNLGYLQCSGWIDASLKALFVGGHYDDLAWVLRSLREVPTMMDRVQEVLARPGEWPFGLGRDPWIDWTPELRQMTGRYSVAASFPVHVWRELGGFDPDLVYAFDLQLLHHNLSKRRWALFVNNPPLLHLKSSDTEAISAEKTAEAGTRFLTSTYDGFRNKFGWHIEHFLNIYFSESTVVHRDAILRAANQRRFGDIDFVFDDFADRLGRRRLENCELTWCRSRAACPYSGQSA